MVVLLVNATDLDQVHFSVMSQESASVKTTPWVKSVTCASGDSLGFLMLRVKVRRDNMVRHFCTATA